MAMERTRSKSNFSFFHNPAMERTNGAVDDEHCPKSVNSPAVFRGTPSSSFHSFLALSIWLGGIHLTVILVLTTLFFLPLPLAISSVMISSSLFQLISHQTSSNRS